MSDRYYLTPTHVAEVELKEPPLPELACVIKAGTCIEASLQRGKREVGMDAYQVRTWQGWHHHIALSPTFKGCLQRIDISGQFLELRTDVSEEFLGKSNACEATP